MAKPTSITIDRTYMPKNTDVSHRRIEEVVARHDILRRAGEAGRKNEPPTKDTQLDEAQLELVDDSHGFIGTVSRMAGSEITGRGNDIRMAMPVSLDTAVERITIRREVAEAKDRHRDDLDYAYQNQQRSLRDLREFEEENRLPPLSAVYKSDRLMFASSLIALILAEGAFNTFNLQELQDLGLVGGLVLALAVSLANILIGLGTGFIGWRLMVHVKPVPRVLGIATTIIFMVAGLALNLALADLREAILYNPKAQIDFLVILKPERWFAYTSIAPFVLFAVGVATFLIAALKGRGGTWGVVAPYWGHDVLDRRYREADAELQDAKANLKDALQNAFDGERAKLRARFAAEAEQLDKIRRLAAEAHGVERTLRDSIDAEIGRLHIGLRMYRDRNRSVRTAPPPAYFDTYPAFDEWRATRLDLSELVRLVDAAERIHAENAEKLAALEETTLGEQIATIEAMTELTEESEQRSVDRIDKDDAVRRKRPK